MSVRILVGDCREVLSGMEAKSVHMVVTSPPYYGLRDYKIEPSIWGGDSKCRHQWKSSEKNFTRNAQKTDTKHADRGGNPYANRTEFDVSTGEFCTKCNAWRGTFGLEPDVEMYVEHSVEIFKAVWRVLRDDGTFWLNLGDSYASGEIGRHDALGAVSNNAGINYKKLGEAQKGKRQQHKIITNLMPKNLLGVPWRVAFALQKAGWYLRSDIVWHKPNVMPSSVTDRVSTSHEYIFMLTKKPRYFFDYIAIQEPSKFANGKAADFARDTKDHLIPNQSTIQHRLERKPTYNTGTRNKRSVWEVPTSAFPGSHFAVFPPKLIEPCIRAGTSSKGCCAKCGSPWIRTSEKVNTKNYEYLKVGIPNEGEQRGRRKGPMGNSQYESKSWEPSCNCKSKVIPCTVLDPFGGSGTTGMVCSKLERDAILIEINPKYAEMARRRAGQRFTEIWNVEND